MKSLTVNNLFEEIKKESKTASETIEIANDISKIINRIVQTRIELGLTQAELAEKCGLKQSAVARVENLQVMPRLDTIVRIAKSLNISIFAEIEDFCSCTIEINDPYINTCSISCEVVQPVYSNNPFLIKENSYESIDKYNHFH